MAPALPTMITRSDDDPLVPVPVSMQVIQEVPKFSAALGLTRRVPMSSKTLSQPVLSVLPQAYWVGGDTGLKNTTRADWENVRLVAEEIAVIVPIPEAYLDDMAIPVWSEVKPLIAQAFGQKIDEAILFDIDKPASWTSESIVTGAIDHDNIVTFGTGDDLGVDIADMGKLLARQGYSLNAFASEPGFGWTLIGARDAEGRAIYGSGDLATGRPATIYGKPNYEIENGVWDYDVASLVGGDFRKAVHGMRQDMTFRVFTEGVISDDDGKVILNLMQQDSVALRVVMRMGYALANPVSPLAAAEDRFPFAVLTSSGS